jgi:electron transfer flavoprotein beta subunit
MTMLKMVVCIKQVPMVSELPWDSRTGTLKREIAEGMMNPACKHALEAALRIKHEQGGHITVITMGPPMAAEVLYEALTLGADRGILLTDKKMAGADTLITSFTIARAIEKECPGFDLVICGSQTSDSETAQVGPQLAEELKIPSAAYIESLECRGKTIRMKRLSDDFLETLEMDLPGLVTITTRHFHPRYATLSGLEEAFQFSDITILSAEDLGLSPDCIGMKASPTRILDVFSVTAEKENYVMKGAVKKILEEVFEKFGDRISSAMGKDLKTHEHSD